jgi:hypothetical protein
MVWSIGSATFPKTPERMSVELSANAQTESVAGNFPDALVDGKVKSITISGKLEGAWESCYDSILSILEGYVGTSQTVTFGAKISGTYMVASFKYDPENPMVTPYTVKLSAVHTVFALS